MFSWILHKSRREGDRINKKRMADPCMKDMMDAKALPFDAKRMDFGGVKPIVSLCARSCWRSCGVAQFTCRRASCRRFRQRHECFTIDAIKEPPGLSFRDQSARTWFLQCIPEVVE